VVFAVHIAAFFESLNHVSIASCLVLTDTAVFFVALFMMVFFKEAVSRKGWAIIALTFGGCVLITVSDMTGENGLLGDMLALLSSVLFAVYAMVGRRVRSRVSTLVYTSILYSSAAVTSFTIIAVSDLPSMACGPNDLLLGLGLAVCCTIFGHTVYNWGLRFEKAAFVAITTLLEPVFGTFLGFLIFGEVPGILVVMGSAVVLLGVYLFSLDTSPERADGRPEGE
jgi:drug/metabolite transporter (DMT)-like permease